MSDCQWCHSLGLVDIDTAAQIMAAGIYIGQQPISAENQHHYTCVCVEGLRKRAQVVLSQQRRVIRRQESR